MIALQEVLEPGRSIRELEAGLFSALGAGDEGAPYDSRAAGYDWLVSSRWYSSLAWGVAAAAHTDFIRRGLASSHEGWVLDVAAGSCVPSASAYTTTSRPLVVLDRSLGMLRRGMARLRQLHGALPRHVAFLQADASALPFRAGSLATVICHGALHVFSSPSDVCAEWLRVLRPGGQLFVSSLVRGRWLGDRYLALLHRAGEVTRPRSAAEVARFVEAAVGAPARLDAVGNFAYLSLQVPGAPRP
ncbi:MAG TPA: class I SAM-dependent methyltransferase [Myxococcota bacterium]